MELKPLKRERAIDGVYGALREAILSSKLRPGDRLEVAELADRLGVSLTPVRQAVQQLATEGLVEVRPRGGAFVAVLSPKDVEETFEIRCALECMAAELAVKRISEDEIRRAHEPLEQLRQPVLTDQDRVGHQRDNLELHMILIRASGNRKLVELYRTLNAHIQIARVHAAERDWTSRAAQE